MTQKHIGMWGGRAWEMWTMTGGANVDLHVICFLFNFAMIGTTESITALSFLLQFFFRTFHSLLRTGPAPPGFGQ